MSGDPRRLQRLIRAQADLAQLLEIRIAEGEQRGRQLAEARAGTVGALDRLSTAGLAFYASALRHLDELDRKIAGNDSSKRELLAKLLVARARQEVLHRRAGEQLAAQARRTLMEETQEVVLAMQEKAPGKRDVLE